MDGLILIPENWVVAFEYSIHFFCRFVHVNCVSLQVIPAEWLPETALSPAGRSIRNGRANPDAEGGGNRTLKLPAGGCFLFPTIELSEQL